MVTLNQTPNQNYELPFRRNPTAVDVERIIAAITAIDSDVAGLLSALLTRAPLADAALTGAPTAPTQPAGTNNNTLATTGHVQLALEAFLTEAVSALEVISALEDALGEGDLATALVDLINLKAPLADPAFTGVPTAPTADAAVNTTQIATTAFVQAVAALLVGGAPTGLNTLGKISTALGGDAGFATTLAATLAGKAPLANPEFTGNPTVPTQSPGNNSTRVANTAFVAAAIALAVGTLAPLASPALTGTPTAPTQSSGDNSTRIATTAFVKAVIDALVPDTRSISAGTGLTGGGNLSANRVIAHADTSSVDNFSAGASSCVAGMTFDGMGHVTGATRIDVIEAQANALAGQVGSYCFAQFTGSNETTFGTVRPGSSVRAASVDGDGLGLGATRSGSWMCLGHIPANSNRATVWLRVS